MKKIIHGALVIALLYTTVFSPITAHAIDVPSEKTEYWRTDRNTDLTYTKEVFPYPVFQQDPVTGTWSQSQAVSSTENIGYVSENQPDSVLSGDNFIKAGTDETGQHKAFIKFSNATLPSLNDGLLTSATLKLNEYNNTNTPGYDAPAYKDSSFTLHKVMGSWNASNLTWNTQPEISLVPYATETEWIKVGGPIYKWNVTKLVQEWYQNPASYYGLAIQSSNNTPAIKSFNKIEQDLNIVPALQITYSPKPEIINKNSTVIDSNTIKFDLAWYSVQGAKGYKIIMSNGTNQEIFNVSSSTTSWSTIKTGELSNYYYFNVIAYNDFGESISDQATLLVADSVAPSIPSNIRVTDEHFKNFTIEWDPSTDNRAGEIGYAVTIKDAITGQILYNQSTNLNKLTLDMGYSIPRRPVEIYIAAIDQNNNHSANSQKINAVIRKEYDARISSYSVPAEVSGTYSMAFDVYNEGSTTWSAGNGSEFKSSNHSIKLNAGDIIKPGEKKRFEITVTPTQEGVIQDTWQMFNHLIGNFGENQTTKTTYKIPVVTPPPVVEEPPIIVPPVSEPLPPFFEPQYPRFGGKDRYAVQEQFNAEIPNGTLDYVLVASGLNFPDALSSGVLNNTLNATTLLIQDRTSIIEAKIMEAKRLLKPNGKVLIIGGTGSVSSSIENQFKQHFTVDRIDGKNRTAVSINVANRVDVDPTEIFLTYGLVFSDSLSVVPYATKQQIPIILQHGTTLNSMIKQYIQEHPTIKKVTIVSGTGVIPVHIENELKSLGITIVERVAGKDRYDTSLEIAKKYYPAASNIALSNGTVFADALSGSRFAYKKEMPILLVRKDSMIEGTKNYVKGVYPENIYLYGGTGTLSETIINQFN